VLGCPARFFHHRSSSSSCKMQEVKSESEEALAVLSSSIMAAWLLGTPSTRTSGADAFDLRVTTSRDIHKVGKARQPYRSATLLHHSDCIHKSLFFHMSSSRIFAPARTIRASLKPLPRSRTITPLRNFTTSSKMSSAPGEQFEVRQTSTSEDYTPDPSKSLKLSPARQALVDDIIALYSCQPTIKRVERYTPDCVYDDQFVYANDRYKMGELQTTSRIMLATH
jgi:hypothetical protein